MAFSKTRPFWIEKLVFLETQHSQKKYFAEIDNKTKNTFVQKQFLSDLNMVIYYFCYSKKTAQRQLRHHHNE